MTRPRLLALDWGTSNLRAGEKLATRIDQQLHDVQKNRRLVRSFFDAPSVAYISDC